MAAAATHDRWVSGLEGCSPDELQRRIMALAPICSRRPRSSTECLSRAASVVAVSCSSAANDACIIIGVRACIAPLCPSWFRPAPSAPASGPSKNVIKTELDVVGHGFHPQPPFEDIIPLNRWVLKADVPGRKEAVGVPPSRGRTPRLGHFLRPQVPSWFYVQLDEDDLHFHVVPEAFQEHLISWLHGALPRSVRVSSCRGCELFVQVQEFGGQVVLGRGWRSFCFKHKMEEGDIVVLHLNTRGFSVKVFNATKSIAKRYSCGYTGH